MWKNRTCVKNIKKSTILVFSSAIKTINPEIIESKKLKLPIKLHAEQLSHSGGVKLATSFNAISVDHLEYANEDDDSEYNYRTAEQLGDLPPFVPAQDRDLVAFNIYRDGDYLATVDAGIYAYDDFDVVNLTEYCYTVTSVYEVGES